MDADPNHTNKEVVAKTIKNNLESTTGRGRRTPVNVISQLINNDTESEIVLGTVIGTRDEKALMKILLEHPLMHLD